MGWTVLPLSDSSAPQLLVKTRFDKGGYSVQLTDLGRLWLERLTKDEIIQRALDTGSSIDPSEDDEQFGIFLSKVESALNCEEGTSLRLASGDGVSPLGLELEAPLPHPLPPFKWTVNLQLQPEQQVEGELVTPLIQHASSLQRKIQQLVDQLHDKDRIISKICDRLETSGNDLTTVFPGASNIKTSRKKGQREQLAKHVKGLADFDEVSWRNQSGPTGDDEGLDAKIINDVFADLPSGPHLSNSETIKWWERLNETSADISKPVSTGRRVNASRENNAQDGKSNATLNHEDNVQVDEFQRQETPPHRNRPQSAHSQGSTTVDRDDAAPIERDDEGPNDSTTDDEDDLDAPPPKLLATSKAKPAEKPAPTSSRKLGMIGGQRSQSPPSEPPRSEEKSEVPKPRGKLGTIGGKPKRSEVTPDYADETTNGAQEALPAPRPKLGAVGGKAASRATATPPPVTTAQSTKSHDAIPSRLSDTRDEGKASEPEETAEELADRKRDILKRELEEKAKVPVKKKRKF